MAAKEKAEKLPPLRVLQTLITKSNTIRTKTSTLNGEYGSAVANAVDEHNVHKGAFSLINKLQRMDGVKLNAFLTHFDDYREKLGIDKLKAEDLTGLGGADGKDDADKAKVAKDVAAKTGSEAPLKDDDPTGQGQKAPMFN